MAVYGQHLVRVTVLTSLVTGSGRQLDEHEEIEVVTRRTKAAMAQTMVLSCDAALVSVALRVLPVYRSGKILVR